MIGFQNSFGAQSEDTGLGVVWLFHQRIQFIGCDMIAGNELGIYIEFGYIHVGDFKTQKWGIIMYK